MNLLVAYIVSLLVAQSLAIAAGLAIERLHSPYAGLVTFIAGYFFMFWAAWKFAVRITEPRTKQETPAASA
jgi:hypothetical protein